MLDSILNISAAEELTLLQKYGDKLDITLTIIILLVAGALIKNIKEKKEAQRNNHHKNYNRKK